MKVSIKVFSGRKKEEIVLKKDGKYSVYTRSVAKNNKANKAAVKMLAKYFQTSPSCVSIIKGAKSKNKIIEIMN